ncbi:hypothetical protein LPJ53_003956 [Coemansia erecta]|uniref:Rab-GAP TBC domain-containing protein n=1 Tax=Coemansia erecta TaxID=147472 RepID=A0A9W8CS71_9FUNG|nr:hypothetical protein LPJ53_003956 [Coemansia erecta]
MRSAGDLSRHSPRASTSLARRPSLPALSTSPPSPRACPDAKPARNRLCRPPSIPTTSAAQPHLPSSSSSSSSSSSPAPAPAPRPGALQLRRRQNLADSSALSIGTLGKHTLHLALPSIFLALTPTSAAGTLSPACTSFAHAEVSTAVSPGCWSGGVAPLMTAPASSASVAWMSPATATAHGMLCRLAGVARSPVGEKQQHLSDAEWAGLFEQARADDGEARARLCRLVRAGGVPGEMRRALWVGLAEAVEIEVKQAAAGPAVEAIDLDVLRTSDDPRVVAGLRHVLHAYYHACPATGYCQGMDKIAHALLRLLGTQGASPDTHSALSLFHLLLDRILPPTMFRAPLARLMDDQRVLAQLVARRLPRLAQHLGRLDVALAPVTFSWFATLFAGHLEDALLGRLWDVVLVERSYGAVFEAALAVLAFVEEEVVACVVGAQVYTVLQGACRRAGEAGEAAFARWAFAEDARARVMASEIEIIRCELGITG